MNSSNDLTGSPAVAALCRLKSVATTSTSWPQFASLDISINRFTTSLFSANWVSGIGVQPARRTNVATRGKKTNLRIWLSSLRRIRGTEQSFADPHDTAKAVVRAAGIDGITDLAIQADSSLSAAAALRDPGVAPTMFFSDRARVFRPVGASSGRDNEAALRERQVLRSARLPVFFRPDQSIGYERPSDTA